MRGANLPKPIVFTFELEPDGSPDAAIANAMQKIQSAHFLGLAVQLETVKDKAFRHGGNVTMADIVSYRVTVGKAVDEGKDKR